MYYLVYMDDNQIILLYNVVLSNWCTFEKTEYIFTNENEEVIFVAPTMNVYYIRGTSDLDDFKEMIKYAKAGDDVVCSI